MKITILVKSFLGSSFIYQSGLILDPDLESPKNSSCVHLVNFGLNRKQKVMDLRAKKNGDARFVKK
jgi:hypothetical protein